jgi:hypothetical protein
MQQLLSSQEFIESLALLVIAALLTGILVPLVKLFFDFTNFRKQRLFEDRLARQNNIIESQIKFLETISTLLWEYHALIAKVSYYQIHEPENGNKNNDEANSAAEQYEEHFWELVIQNIQAEISKSRRLVSPSVYKHLKVLYTDVIIKTDSELVSLIENNASREEWVDFHEDRLKGKLVSEIDDTLHMLAEDMDLAKENYRGSRD